MALAASGASEVASPGHGLSKARLKRVSGRLVWGLLVWGSSPARHTEAGAASGHQLAPCAAVVMAAPPGKQ
eukprot:scaffold56721_cov53-Phaeocystis_antarctica.AAC.1